MKHSGLEPAAGDIGQCGKGKEEGAVLIPTIGRHPTKGWIDFRWKHLGKHGFAAAFGPISWSSFRRFILWKLKRRGRE